MCYYKSEEAGTEGDAVIHRVSGSSTMFQFLPSWVNRRYTIHDMLNLYCPCCFKFTPPKPYRMAVMNGDGIFNKMQCRLCGENFFLQTHDGSYQRFLVPKSVRTIQKSEVT